MSNDDSIHSPYLTLPGATGMPDIHEILSQMPDEQKHRFESSGEFIRRLAIRVTKWREGLPEDEEPAIFALMSNGDAVEVHSLGEDGHSSVVVEGSLQGAPACLLAINLVFKSCVIRAKLRMKRRVEK